MDPKEYNLIEDLRRMVKGYHFSFQSEKELQDQFERMLTMENVPFWREHALGPGDRPDFQVQRMALEVKLGGAVTGHLRQMKRYARHDVIEAVTLVCTRVYPLPPALNGKPCHCLSVGFNRL